LTKLYPLFRTLLTLQVNNDNDFMQTLLYSMGLLLAYHHRNIYPDFQLAQKEFVIGIFGGGPSVFKCSLTFFNELVVKLQKFYAIEFANPLLDEGNDFDKVISFVRVFPSYFDSSPHWDPDFWNLMCDTFVPLNEFCASLYVSGSFGYGKGYVSSYQDGDQKKEVVGSGFGEGGIKYSFQFGSGINSNENVENKPMLGDGAEQQSYGYGWRKKVEEARPLDDGQANGIDLAVPQGSPKKQIKAWSGFKANPDGNGSGYGGGDQKGGWWLSGQSKKLSSSNSWGVENNPQGKEGQPKKAASVFNSYLYKK